MRYILIILLLLIAMVSDINSYKIKNKITISFMLAGLIINICMNGIYGLLHSVAAMMVPVALLMPLFALRMLGAGDIKLFSALGSIMGIKYILSNIVFSFFSGGIIALILLMIRKNWKERIQHMVLYIKTCCISHTLYGYCDFNDKSKGDKFHFSCSIAMGALVQLLLVLYKL